MKTLNKVALLVMLFAGMLQARPAQAQAFKTRLYKPDHTFFYYQLNFHSGFDAREPGSGYGLATRGPRTQVSFEWFVKDERRIQRGYTRLLTPNAWNVKFALEMMPQSGGFRDMKVGFRLLDTWINVSTKWDRTSLRIGHKSLPYGHNPRIDGTMSFLPNQAGLDLGFGRDTGLFFKTPLSERLDLELAATAGGFLSGTPFYVQWTGEGAQFDTKLNYRGSWLGSVRVGTPTFKDNEYGLFAVAGTLHNFDRPMVRVARIGGEWVVKRKEMWKMVNQVAVGTNYLSEFGSWGVVNVLNSMEVFYNRKLRLGMTHALHLEGDRGNTGVRPFKGTVYGTVSYVLYRDARFRINPYFEYNDNMGQRDAGVLFQVCVGCGLRK
ncbi:hypothetical protein [Rhodocaloribacter sp.]